VIREILHRGMGPEPGVAKYVDALDGRLPCSSCSDQRPGGLTLPVLLAGVEEQRIAKLYPQISHIDD
jgi:hypothetical protein